MRSGAPAISYASNMTAPLDSNRNPHIPDRRSDRRQRVLFSSVVIGDANCGRVLDISPKGFALQTDSELVGDEFPNFRFKFSPTLAWVEAKGRVVWRNNSKNVVGLEFIDLTEEVHKQIQTWMDSKKQLGGIGAVILGPAPAPATVSAPANSVLVPPASDLVDLSAENRDPAAILPPVQYPAESRDARTTAGSAVDKSIAGGMKKVLWLVGLALVATLLVNSPLLRRLHWRKLSNNQKTTETAGAPHPAVLRPQPVPPPQPVAPPKPVPSPSVERPSVPSNRTSSLNGPAFVVQVGAMIHQENANALAASLREMKYPAFVIKLPTERFHHVLIGPYNSVDATRKVQKELEERGFKTLRNEWKVSSR
ncbi:MAG: SPOR domain-containing protein [Candidatus Acidiferrum sp.]